jgi:hypothetical protein
MPANNTGALVRKLAAQFPDAIGHLFSPGGERQPFAPVALDNGVFAAGDAWIADPWLALLDWVKANQITPEWVLIPDVVGNRSWTLRRWQAYWHVAHRYGWPLAFAAQDGMTFDDVPKQAEVVFVGGSTTWKWRTMASWCAHFPRVHVGRVNSYRRLWQCRDAGVESCDGTGWMRGDQVQYRGLVAYLEENADLRTRHEQLKLATA